MGLVPSLSYESAEHGQQKSHAKSPPSFPERTGISQNLLRPLTRPCWTASSAHLDEVLISYFQNGRSFTGEDTLEISCHGSEVLVDEIVAPAADFRRAPVRRAERGEFTYRAFMSGRISTWCKVTRAFKSLIESRSQRAAQLAFRQLQGDFSQAV